MIWAFLSAVLGAIVGFAAVGLGAASILTAALGSRDGGPAMSGFFGFGPIGAIAGALLGAGLVLWLGKRSPKVGRGLVIAGTLVTFAGTVLLTFASQHDDRPSYAYVIQFELEYPAATLAGIEMSSRNAMWGVAAGNLDDTPISQFYADKCNAETCILDGSVAATGEMDNFRIATKLGQKKYRYVLDVPLTITGPTEWSEWRAGDGARSRWRITKN